MTDDTRTPLPCTLAALTAPLADLFYCSTCGTWYDPSNPQGDHNHHH